MVHSIEVYLSDFDTDDIVSYLESEGVHRYQRRK